MIFENTGMDHPGNNFAADEKDQKLRSALNQLNLDRCAGLSVHHSLVTKIELPANRALEACLAVLETLDWQISFTEQNRISARYMRQENDFLPRSPIELEIRLRSIDTNSTSIAISGESVSQGPGQQGYLKAKLEQLQTHLQARI